MIFDRNIEEVVTYTRLELETKCQERHQNWLFEWNEYELGIEDHALLGMKEEYLFCQINYTNNNWSYLEKSVHRDEVLTH